MSIHTRRLEARKEASARRLIELANERGLSVADLRNVRLPWYEIRNQASEGEPATILIYDEIGGSLGVQAEQFARDLEEIDAPEIRVRINSPGGSVFDAIAIYNSLNHHPARIVAYVDSLAASAASVIAMAGGEVVMMPGSQMMIHDASAVQEGNADEMASMAAFLGRQSDNIAGLYRRKAGGEVADWRELMLAETWAFADEAVELGLADRVQSDDRDLPDAGARERMARQHDITAYRYAGRRAAPAPRTRSSRPAPEPRPAPSPVASRASSDADRRHAAQQRTDAAGGRPAAQSVARHRTPAGMSASRMAAFPARLRAELVEHNGQRRYHVTGHASVTDAPYEMWDSQGPYMEVIERGAFTRTLAAGPDVAFLVNHRGVTMARTTNDTLRLSVDDVGLSVEAWLNPKRQDVSDLVTAIEDKDVDEMSFAFMLAEGGGRWDADFMTFRVSEVDIDRGDVSAVNYGANPYTDVAARSREILADLDHLPAGAARAAVTRLQARPDVGGTSVEETQLAVDVAEATATPAGRSLAHVEALLET